METTVLILGMLLSFVLGAYVREPFTFKRNQDKPQVPVLPAPVLPLHEDKYIQELIRQDRSMSEKRRGELMNAWNYNGNPQKEVDERD